MQQPELSFMEEISRSAGEILRENYGKLIEVQHKSTADLHC